MQITNYLRAGYASVFCEAIEIKRCVKSISVDLPFEKLEWDFVTGLEVNKQKEEANQVEILNKATELQQKAIILENFDLFLENPIIMQTFLNNYETYKSNQVCLVMVGNSSSKIPVILKELIPVIEFNLPNKEEIRKIAEIISTTAEEDFKQSKDYDKNKKEFDFHVSEELISACLGLSHEEVESILALSLIEHKKLDTKTVLERKRQVIRQTGFMDFINPEPIENLGGLDKLKEYIFKRKEAFIEGSIKPKIKSMVMAGFPGTGKTMAAKAIISIFVSPSVKV